MSDANEQITNCPNAESLMRCVLGRLPPDLHESVTAHVDRCARCQETIKTLGPPSDEFVASLRRPLARDGFEEEEECATSISHVESVLAGALEPYEQPTLASGDGFDQGDRAVVVQGVTSSESSVKAPDDASPDPEQLGPYRLLEKLGAGGMGTVYKALHTKLDRTVAVKVLGKTRLNDADAVARFEREMKAVGRLQHQHIVHATDADEENGVHYLVMEFVDGMDLSRLGRRLAPLPVAEACELVRQAAIGLQYVHEHGLVHRDIKPSNLMLTRGESPKAEDRRPKGKGQHPSDAAPMSPSAYSLQSSVSPPTVKILDLGLALLGSESGDDGLTSTGQVMGTIDYMPPEQFENTHGVDIRADVYSLGATLYKLLTGRAPFSGEKYGSSLEKLAALARDEVPSVSTHRNDLPATLVAVMDGMLSRNPAERFQTPGKAGEALTSFAEGADLVALWERAESAPESSGDPRPTAVAARTMVAARRPRRTEWLVGWIAALLVIAASAVWATSRFLVRDEPSVSGQPQSLAVQSFDIRSSDFAYDVDLPSPESTNVPADLKASPQMVELSNGWRVGEPVNLGSPVNSQWNDSDPAVTADGLTLLFASNRSESDGLWISTRASTGEPWGDPVRVGLNIDETVSRFGADISADGLSLLFASERPGGIGGQDLWQTTRTGTNAPWGEPVNLGSVVNSDVTDVSPSLSDDGLILLFASGRPGEDWKSSIWMTTRPSIDDPWREPVKLPPTINSSLTEGGADLSSDGLALVFESRREGGVGVGDLWMCTRSSIDGPWSEPVNLGVQVNTTTWDAAPAFAENDTAIYFSSRRPKGNGKKDGDIDIWKVPIKRPESQENAADSDEMSSTAEAPRSHRI